ncbi:MAG: KGK domain-containing protein [Microcoleaceae cyanobacterium]
MNQRMFLTQEDVVSVYGNEIFVKNRTFTVNEFLTEMKKALQAQLTEGKENWLTNGIDCKILKPGAKSWQRGKVKITLEFEPENLEVKESDKNNELEENREISPLDDLRHKIKPDNK